MPAAVPGLRALLNATLPYLIIIVLILLTRLVPPLRDTLRDATLGWSLAGGYSGSVALLYHPGTLLLFGFVLAGLLRTHGRMLILPAARRAASRLPMVALALLSVLLLARLMVHSGMIELLATRAAATLGDAWLLAAAAQGFGAAIGNIIAPHNIVVGAAAVGIIGAEGQVLRRTLPACLAYVGAGGLLLLLFSWAT